MQKEVKPTINGIIAEYNPFHNGHKYQLDCARRETGAEYTVVVMSGNFMQRGTPALLDKYKRAEMALKCGADLVLELPSYYSAASAEYFAMGAVSLMDKLGAVDNLCFGSECGDVSILEKISDILLEEPAEYTACLKKNLRRGLSYPSARSNALEQYCPEISQHLEVLTSANNILGIEYIKALKRRQSPIKPVTTLRSSSNYHDRMLGVHQSSALALRQAVYDSKNINILADQMPAAAFETFHATLEQNTPIELNDLSATLHYKLLSEADNGFDHYFDISEDLSDRIAKNLYHFKNFRNFCELLKTKDMTYTHISRCLIHILLNMEKSTMEQYKRADYILYARVLGFRRESEPLLGIIKSRTAIPLLTKLADAEQLLSPAALAMLKQEIRINSIYGSVSALKSGRPIANEYSTPIVIVE